MEKFYKRILEQPSSPQVQATNETLGPSMKKRFFEFDLEKLPNDPGLRPRMSSYHPNDRDEIRRYYLQKGPCQPKEINFPQRQFGNALRRFNPDWYLKYGNWLEYSQKEDATFCLCCYLMRSDTIELKGGGEAFITKGFTNWKNSGRFDVHVGDSSSRHKEKLINLTHFYPSDISLMELLVLDNQLENYFRDVCSDNALSGLKGISDLAIKLVETRKHIVYPMVYLLIELALILPVATATVERVFSAMNIIKNRMRNRMRDN